MPVAKGPGSAQWVARYRMGRVTLPVHALRAGHRCVHVATAADGTRQLIATDRLSGVTRQVTSEKRGVVRGWLDGPGCHVIWFAPDAGEAGGWRWTSFDGGQPASLGRAGGRPAGVAVAGTRAFLGTTDGSSTTLLRVDLHGVAEPEAFMRLPGGIRLACASADGTLIALSEPIHGDPRHPRVRVISVADGRPVEDLVGGGQKGEPVYAVAFSPVPGDQRLLALSENDGRAMPVVWGKGNGTVRPRLDVDGEARADWYPDGRALLVCVIGRGRSWLVRADLETGAVSGPLTPPGFVRDATVRPDGSVEYLWSSGQLPPRIVNSVSGVVWSADSVPPALPCQDLTVEGPGGPVQAFLTEPTGTRPFPAVFVMHGGPAVFDSDSFNPYVAAWADAGFAVVRVNYRGSTGFGRDWRLAAGPQAGYHVGWAELEDVGAVRDHLVADGVVDPRRLALAGSSWGGYLSLLAAGRHPASWAVVVADSPICDYELAYEEETEQLRALDRAVFGGSPGEVPDRWRASSPLTYAGRIRAPLLITAGRDDPRCPPGQVESFARRAVEAGVTCEVEWHEAGHGAGTLDDRIRQVERQLRFVTVRLAT